MDTPVSLRVGVASLAFEESLAHLRRLARSDEAGHDQQVGHPRVPAEAHEEVGDLSPVMGLVIEEVQDGLPPGMATAVAPDGAIGEESVQVPG